MSKLYDRWSDKSIVVGDTTYEVFPDKNTDTLYCGSSFEPVSPSPAYPQPISPSLPAGTYQVTLQGKLYEITLSEDLRGVPQAKDCIELEGYSATGRIKRVFNATFDTCTTQSVFDNYTTYLLETPTTEAITLTPVTTSTAPILPTMAYMVTEPSTEYMMPLVSPQNGTFNVKTSADGTPASVALPTLRSVGDVSDEIVVFAGAAKQRIATGYIAGYNGEIVGGAWTSSTGALTTGAEIVYVLSEPLETDISDTPLGQALLSMATGEGYTRVYTASDNDVLNDVMVGYNSNRTALAGGEITAPCEDYPVAVTPTQDVTVNGALVPQALYAGDSIHRAYDGAITYTRTSGTPDPTLPLSQQPVLDTPEVTHPENAALSALKTTPYSTSVTATAPVTVTVRVND